MPNDLKAYGQAKKLVPELKKLLTHVEQCIIILKPHQKYAVIFDSLDKLHDARIILQSHLIQQTKIVVSKGKTQ